MQAVMTVLVDLPVEVLQICEIGGKQTLDGLRVDVLQAPEPGYYS